MHLHENCMHGTSSDYPGLEVQFRQDCNYMRCMACLVLTARSQLYYFSALKRTQRLLLRSRCDRTPYFLSQVPDHACKIQELA